ncbi:beta-galactosidase [Candidatus Daviesbacteria bacterium]|nr:beta-galactosidase [Candidatus Daviesbacteria bacterium]
MSHLPFTILAYFFNSISVTVDKFLLTKHIQNPLVYIFYISAVSLLALFLLPFARVPGPQVFALASLSTILWTAGAYFLYKGLKEGIATRVVPVIGTLVPLILLLFAYTSKTVSIDQIWAASILVLGLIFITLPSWKGEITWQEIVFELLSACFFALSYIILRQAYLQENFLTVLVYSRFILLPLGGIILLVPKLRRIILPQQNEKFNFLSKTGILFMLGQITGGSQELLLTFSVSLADPSVVNSLQGTQYVFLLIFGLMLSKRYPAIFKESISKLSLIAKILGILLICLGLYILAGADTGKKAPETGITFSPRYAQSLGLDPGEAYTASLDELKVKNLRLPIYWDEIQKEQNSFDRTYMMDYLDEAQKKGINIILVIGYKQPRWPECFAPSWVKNLSDPKFKEAVLNLVSEEIKLYGTYPAIKMWQVENEPTLSHFGDNCRIFGADFLKEEVELVRSLDERPVMVTASGELDTWVIPMQNSDVLGVSLYRTVYNDFFGYTTYPLFPAYYPLKAGFIRSVFAPGNAKTIISELQAEPWASKNNLVQTPLDEQIRTVPVKAFKENFEFARQTGMDSIYLWGVEWWYFMKTHGYPQYWEYAKDIFK